MERGQPITPEHTPIRFAGDANGCFACSPHNRHGLGMTFERDGDSVHSRLTIGREFQGAPGFAHGGIIATALDEISCAAVAFTLGRLIVTGELSIRYQAPIPVDTNVTVSAQVTDDSHARYAVVQAHLLQDGQVAATGKGKFFYVDRSEDAGPIWQAL